VASVGGNVDTADTPTAEPGQEPADKQPTAAGLNQSVRDGKFEFRVTKVDCSKTSLGPQGLAEKAQGKFCIVSMNVRNIGTEAQALSATDQYGYDSSGSRYNTSDQIMALIDQDSPLYEDVNPGNQRQAQLIFDVPKNADLTHVELHDSAFSDGVRVDLQ
jgi:hypothetical protein